MNQWQNIQSYLNRLEADIAGRAPRNSGNLANSITANIEQGDDNGFTISVSMLDYGYYQDQGVNGTERNWGSPFSYTSKRPPAIAFASYTSNIQEQYAIAYSIYKNGIRPKNFIEPTINNHLDELGDFAVEDLWDYFYQQNK